MTKTLTVLRYVNSNYVCEQSSFSGVMLTEKTMVMIPE